MAYSSSAAVGAAGAPAAPATFHPSQYEVVYGFDLLDTLHNFFPEMMYDDDLFRESMLLQWMRDRVQTLLPAYARQKSLYSIYQRATRHRQFHAWLATQRPVVAAAATATATATATRAAAAAPVPTTVTTTAVAAAAPSVRLRPIAHIRATTSPTLDAGDQSFLQHLFSSSVTIPSGTSFQTNITQAIASLLTEALGDVTVAPTAEEIAEASTLVPATQVREDCVCAICQEHAATAAAAAEEWRRLQCDHMFHRTCIDTWFAHSVRCPVCRRDIRENSEGDDGNDSE